MVCFDCDTHTHSHASFVRSRWFELDQQPVIKFISHFLILGYVVSQITVTAARLNQPLLFSEFFHVSPSGLHYFWGTLGLVFLCCCFLKSIAFLSVSTALVMRTQVWLRVLPLFFGQEHKMGQVQTRMANCMHAAFLFFLTLFIVQFIPYYYNSASVVEGLLTGQWWEDESSRIKLLWNWANVNRL